MKLTTVVCACATSAICSAASAGIFQFGAVIDGTQEVPANASPATGTMTGTYDSDANTFSFSWDISDNLIGMPSAPGAHIHRAPAGSNGPIVFPFQNPDGTWPLSGSATWTDLSEENVKSLFAGEFYLNFHTTEFAGGEVRGQIFLIPSPGSAGILAGAALIGLRRRRRD